MKTILIMAQALAEAYGLEILRLDIQFNSIKNDYVGYLDMDCEPRFEIRQNGAINKMERLEDDYEQTNN